MFNFHGDFRRSHIDILIKQIICTEIMNDGNPSDNKSFDVRYKKTKTELRDNVYKFLNAIDTSDCYLSIDKRHTMFLDIVSFTLDNLLHLFFEAGMQSGIIFSLDMKFLKKNDLVDNIDFRKVDRNESIVRELLTI